MREVLRQADVDRVCPTCGSEKIEAGIDLKTGMRRCAACKSEFESDFVNVPLSAVKDLHWVAIKWAHENAFDIHNLVDVEQRLKGEVRYADPRGGPPVPRILTGQLDALLVEGEYAEHAIVLDWKDTWGLPPAHGEDEDDVVSFTGYFQQRFYAWLVFRNYPSVQKVTLREFYVRYSEPREASVSRADEPEIHSELAALAERFDRAWEEALSMTKARLERRPPFRPTAGKHCNYCLRASACPIPQFAREEGRITDPQRAADVARAVIAASKVVKDARASLKGYVDINGPVPVPDAKGQRALGYVEVERTKRPSMQEIRQAEAMKGEPLTADEIEKLYKTTKGTTFKQHQPPEVDESASEDEIRKQLEASIEAAREQHGVDKAA
jgi:hypothetical protein